MTDPALQTVLHASTVSLGGCGLLILGPSGTGKSALALRLLTRGALLVADDRTELARVDDRLVARCPPALAGLIEAASCAPTPSPPPTSPSSRTSPRLNLIACHPHAASRYWECRFPLSSRRRMTTLPMRLCSICGTAGTHDGTAHTHDV